MNKTAIRNFATWARVTLKEEMQQKAGRLGITPACIQKPLPSSTSEVLYFEVGASNPLAVEGKAITARKKIEKRLLQDKTIPYGTAYQALIEEMASTWFNRLAAIRYMEINDYFPDHMRILSSEVKDKVDPDLISRPFDSDLEFTTEEKAQILEWKDKNQNEALFTFLLGKRCRELAVWLPGLFAADDEISEAFLQFSYIDPNGVVYHLVHDIPEEDFQDQVQIIGWLYQYYNSEWKDEVFANLKKNIKVSKENIPAATQLFTPDWIVRYMVENSLGRLWLSGHPDASLQAKWKYYVPEAEQEPAVEAQLQEMNKEYARLKPEDLTLLDPCSGSGHILVYAFDVLMDIYLSQGYTEREAAQSILAHNLYGLDIDDRAYQLTYFSLMIKARQYDRRLFSRKLRPQVCTIEESNGLTKWSDMRGQVEVEQMNLEDQFVNLADELIDTFRDAKNYGSLLQVKSGNYDGLLDYMQQLLDEGCNNLFFSGWFQEVAERMPKLVRQAKLLRQKYWVCVTNPPYMGAGNMNRKLSDFVKKNYAAYKSDMFSACMVRFTQMTEEKGFLGFLSPYVWMFISSYEKLRELFIQQKTIQTLIQFEYSAFEEATVPICTFVLCNHYINKKGVYFRLTDYKGGMEVQREKMLEALDTYNKKMYFESKAVDFSKIPSKPIAYWVSPKIISIFQQKKVKDFTISDGQNKTGNNAKFIRSWWEINKKKIGKNLKWVFCARGGGFRKWYGLITEVIDWEIDARKFYKEDHVARILPEYLWYKEGITWSRITSSKRSFRLQCRNMLFEMSGLTLFMKGNEQPQILLGFLNSKVAEYLIHVVTQVLTLQIRDIQNLPYIINKENSNRTEQIVNQNISVSKADWDSFENSWDFQIHPLLAPSALDMAGLITAKQPTLAERYEQFKAVCEDRFDILQDNEEELNRIFIDIYGLKDELTPDVAPKDVTVYRVFDSKDDIPEDLQGSNYVLTKEDVMKSLLSYAVGCLFGRYSLDTPGLAYAGGEWDAGKYQTFIPDDDNVLPITDEEYFDDDLPAFICGWLKKAFGRENFEANLEFLTDALGTRGATPREKLRNYFLKDFYKDHCRTYQKRPIYWFFDSGKENGFKALVYIHRWNQDTEGRVLLYLHKVQRKYETELRMLEQELDSLTDKHRIGQLEKRREHLEKQLAEVKAYDEKLDHMASEHLVMDLDDGVKVNYEKMQTDREGIRYPILAKIK